MEVGSRALSESARICQIIPIKQLFSAKRILVPESTENLSAIKLENSTIICSTAGSALQTISPWSMQPQYRSPLDKAARKTHLRFSNVRAGRSLPQRKCVQHLGQGVCFANDIAYEWFSQESDPLIVLYCACSRKDLPTHYLSRPQAKKGFQPVGHYPYSRTVCDSNERRDKSLWRCPRRASHHAGGERQISSLKYILCNSAKMIHTSYTQTLMALL